MFSTFFIPCFSFLSKRIEKAGCLPVNQHLKRRMKKTLKVRSHGIYTIFHPIFNRLAQVSRLESIVEEVTRYDFTIDLRLIKPSYFKYFCCTGKNQSILTKESIENRTHFRFSIDFRLCFRLSTQVVTGTILVKNESNEKI